jgi:uncharacterized membrane protein YdcZ (DUF606 family)
MADAALTDVPRSSEESRAFLQKRVAGFGRTLASFVLGFYVFSNAVAMLHPKAQWSDWTSPLNRLVLASGVVCALVWFVCRPGKRRSGAELETIDALGTIATASALGLAAVYGAPAQRPELSSVMGVILFIVVEVDLGARAT